MILRTGCRNGCQLVAGSVAGKSTAFLSGNTDIQRLLLLSYIIPGNESNEKSKDK